MSVLQVDALVIGAGPAGLMAAETLGRAGRSVVLCDARPSPGRKFLMAGKSGLNLTKDEPMARFVGQYHEAAGWLDPMLAAFGPQQVQDWARGLGVPVFTGTTGRVFPLAMKGSPLLRAWLARLDALGVRLRTRWRWQGFGPGGLRFETPEGDQRVSASVTVLALGGASWARLGSDAAWVPWLAGQGVQLSPFRPANMGFSVNWSPHMARHFGAPVKGAALVVSDPGKPDLQERGEFVISQRGIEGGGVYAVSRRVRDGGSLTLDLLPEWSHSDVSARLAMQGKSTLTTHLRKALRLDAVRIALIQEFGRDVGGGLPHGPALAGKIKALPLAHQGPRPLDEAISVAGGIARAAVTDALELRALPGVFACGEMLDWEAPTGGYLLTGCLATGHWAGRAAAQTSGKSAA